MDLSFVDTLETGLPARPGAAWRPGDAWLAGGTWLFSEPQPDVRRLLDLTTLGWPAIELDGGGLRLGATCTVAELYRFAGALPEAWTVGPLIRRCCESFVASFKIWNVATVGGNLCNALPAGPMTSLLAGLGGTCEIWDADGGTREVPVAEFVVGDNRHVLAPGELLRAIRVPAANLAQRWAFRQESLTTYGRSAALLVGRVAPEGVVLTVTASVRRPVVLTVSGAADLPAALATVPPGLYHDDMHGDPRWRLHLTRKLAGEIVRELAS